MNLEIGSLMTRLHEVMMGIIRATMGVLLRNADHKHTANSDLSSTLHVFCLGYVHHDNNKFIKIINPYRGELTDVLAYTETLAANNSIG